MIHEILPVNNYQGNGSSTNFDFDFYIENESQLNVSLFREDGTKVQLELNIDYSINELKNQNGSYITFPISTSKYDILGPEQKISLELILPISQETQYNNSSLLNLKALEYSLDYLTRLIQILARKITRCIKVEECSDNSPDDFLEIVNQAQINSQNRAEFALQQADRAAEMLELVIQNKTQVQDITATQLPLRNLLTSAILSAPSGVMTYSDSAVTVKEGLRVLIPDGLNEDGALKNIDLTLDEDVTWTETSNGKGKRYVIIDESGNISAIDNLIQQEDTPTINPCLWYKPSLNKTYLITSAGTQEVKQTPVGFYERDNLVITAINPYDTCSLLKRTDLAEITSLPFPSNKYTPLTLGASEAVYTAPADGYYHLVMSLSSGKYMFIQNRDLSSNAVNSTSVAGYFNNTNNSANYAIFLPVRKGQKIDISYTGTKVAFNFIYAKGAA